MIPKKGTIERTVFDKLIESGGKGITIYSFNEGQNIDAKSLESAIQNLQSGIYETEIDNSIIFDS